MKKSSGKLFFLFKPLSICLLFICCIFSCKEAEEGCLDIEATNYDVSADDQCPDCCTYPSLKFEVSYKMDTLNMVYSNAYELENGSVIKITKTKFYISDIRLCNGTETFEVRDRIDLDLTNVAGPVNFKDDFTLISRDISSFSYDIGEIRGTGTYDTLRFFIGLDQTASLVDPDMAPEGHDLSIQADSMWNESDAYFFNKLIVVPDTSMMDSVKEFNVFGSKNLIEIVLPFEQRVDLGFDVVVPISIDYQKWLQGIDFVADHDTVIMNEIVNNTTQAFTINN